MERRLAAILAADVVGYARMIRADEDGTIADLRGLRIELLDPKIEEHRGRIVKTMGDGLLIEFASVVDAVLCGSDVQTGMAERNASKPEDRQIVFRIGINLGDVVIDGDDIQGDGVNVAARLEGLSEPGGICIADAVYEQVRDRLDLKFEDFGGQEIKNIDRPVRAWKWSASGTELETKPSIDRHSPPLPEKPSIAVLPFDNMSGDPEQDYFSDGIAEDIITELSRFRSLFVIARNSSFTFKGQAIDVQSLAEKLGVRYVLEGSVRKSGNRIRVTSQLINAPTRKHVWAERYDRKLEDIFEVQDDITKTIVAALEPELSGAERDRAHRTSPDSLDAWSLYQRGLWHMYRFTADDNANARTLFERAIAVDPNFAPAQAGLSFAYFTNAFMGYEGDRGISRDLALEAAERSLVLDDRDESAHWALGRAHMIRADYDLSIDEFRAAIELNCNFAQAHYCLGWSLMLAGRHLEAIPSIDLAERLSPHDPLLFAFYAARAQAHFLSDQFEKAESDARQSSRQANSHANAQAVLLAVLGHRGKSDEATSELARFRKYWPEFTQEDFSKSFPYRRPEDQGRMLDGLRLAGLP